MLICDFHSFFFLDSWYVKEDYVVNIYHEKSTNKLYCKNCANIVGDFVGNDLYYLECVRNVTSQPIIFPTDVKFFVMMQNVLTIPEKQLALTDLENVKDLVNKGVENNSDIIFPESEKVEGLEVAGTSSMIQDYNMAEVSDECMVQQQYTAVCDELKNESDIDQQVQQNPIIFIDDVSPMYTISSAVAAFIEEVE